MEKTELRKEFKNLRNSISDEKRASLSDKIIEKLFSLELFKRAGTVFTYNSFDGEVDTSRILSMPKRIVLPYMQDDRIKVSLADKHMLRGRFGILEPKIKRDIDKDEIDIFIIPGICFDERCNRIGFGHGFFDDLLKDTKGQKIGLCFDFQVTKYIPAQEKDIPMDMIITEKRLIKQ